MKNKQFILFVVITGILALGITYSFFSLIKGNQQPLQAESITVQPVSSTISADGTIRSENEANLNFQTGGKLIYLPFKEGDHVFQGQSVAQLDTYILQRQLTTALNNYRVTRNSFDQTKDNYTNNILQGQQKYAVNAQNTNPVTGDLQNNVVNDVAKRIVDQNQANLDNSVINVELANYALQLSTLTSPINGVVIHEDPTVANVTITPAATFSIADPSTPVFRANVSENDIDFVSVGGNATVQIDGLKGKTFQGTVTKIYPQKITLSGGQQVYQVDIQSDELKTQGKLQQSGTVLIASNNGNQGVMLVPAWTVLSHGYIWVIENDTPILQSVTIGKSHGQKVEILNGLSSGDKIILNPQSIAEKKYQIL